MFPQSAENEFFCDAPPYPIVRACNQLGFRTPEDVRWCHQALPSKEERGWKLFDFHSWKSMMGTETAGKACFCGASLPRMERFTFYLRSGKEANYLLAQCPSCRTIFWDEA